MGGYKEDVSGKRGHLVTCQVGASELSGKTLATQHSYVTKIMILDAFAPNQITYCCKMVLEVALYPIKTSLRL